MQFTGITSGLMIAGQLMRRGHNPVRIIYLGFAIFTLSLYVSSFATNFWAFVFIFGTAVNIGNGIFYGIPVFIAVKSFPSRPGLMAGIVMFTVGLGTIFFTIVSKAMINPLDLDPEIEVKQGTIVYKYYGHQVSDLFP
jgi:MFS family permease